MPSSEMGKLLDELEETSTPPRPAQDEPLDDIIRELVHRPDPGCELTALLDGLAGKPPVSVVAVRLAPRRTRRAAAVHAAPTVRHRR